jgi:chitodextrinase
VTLTWEPAFDDVGVVQYRVSGSIGNTLVSSTSAVMAGLIPDTTYSAAVTALDAAGNESLPSTSLNVTTAPTPPIQVILSVAAGNDDAEESTLDGSIDLTSSDLELTEEAGVGQIVGIRFVGVPLLNGSQVVDARLGFTVDEASTAATSLTIQAEATDDAIAFTTANGDLSARPTTAASVAWSPPAWPAIGASGPDQTSPSLASLVQEVVNRPGWQANSALTFLITGTGGRIAEAWDGTAPARLQIDYRPDTRPPDPPANLGSPSQTEDSVTLSWNPAGDNVGVVQYRVSGSIGTTLVAGTSAVMTGLTPETTYDAVVTALDAAGNESGPSAALVVTTLATPTTVVLSVAASVDDAEEHLNTGTVLLASSDLELTHSAGGTPQIVGLRFDGVGVEPGAEVVEARLRFTVDEVSTGPSDLTVRAQASDDAVPFTANLGDISSRPQTTASVAWSPAQWLTIGASGVDQTTPSLASLAQEVVDRPGWQAGNALVFLVTGTGARTAEATDGTAAPELELTYRLPEPSAPLLLGSGIGLLALLAHRRRGTH